MNGVAVISEMVWTPRSVRRFSASESSAGETFGDLCRAVLVLQRVAGQEGSVGGEGDVRELLGY